MQYRKLGKSDLNIPVVGLGTWAIGGGFWGDQEEDTSIKTLRAGIDAGLKLIDTAPIYNGGIAEEIVGKAIKPYNRADIIIADKVGLRVDDNARRDLSYDSIMWELDCSLKRLDTDYIDLYQCHWPDEMGTPEQETAKTLMGLKEQGIIKAIGVSNYTCEMMDRFMEGGQLDSLQPQYCLLERSIEKCELAYCIENDLGVLTYGSIGAGILSGKYTLDNKPTDARVSFYKYYHDENYPKALKVVKVLGKLAVARGVTSTQLAIAWSISQPGISCALVGARTPEQAIANAAAGDLVLTEDEQQTLQDAYVKYYL